MTGRHTRTAIKSSVWLLTERSGSLALNFIATLLLARAVGAEQFGLLSYAIAFVALLATIPYLGFGSLIVQELTQNRAARGHTMGSVVYAKLAAAGCAFLLANGVGLLVLDSGTARMLVLLISLSMLFDVATALRLHFEAETNTRPVALIGLAAASIGAAARVAAILLAAPLWVYAAIISAQAALAAFGYILIYRADNTRAATLRFNRRWTVGVLGRAWPLMISSAAATIYLKIDQLMLGIWRGMDEVGVYAVAARLSEVWYFVPVAIAAAMFPRLVQLRDENCARYAQRMQESIRYLFLLGFGVAIGVTVTAPCAVPWLLGDDYREAATILSIHVWACPAVFMGVAVEKWLVAEGLLKVLIWRQVLSAATNVGLNLLLIPPFGGVGAAVATVISYTLAYYLSCFGDRRTMQAANWMTQAIAWPVTALAHRVSRPRKLDSQR